jgi:putative hydrolase of the HAD superfamily
VDKKSNSINDQQGPVPALLFDMDNTLFDLVQAQIDACMAVVHNLGLENGNDLFSYFLSPDHGFESHENIRQFMNERNIPLENTFRKACQVYETVKLQQITPYEGVDETLQLLQERGYSMGIVTDAHSHDATLRLEKTGLLPFFCCMVSYDMVKVKKPAHDPFLLALEMMKTSPSDAVLIGDSPRRDIEPGRYLGIRTVYARYGDRFSSDRSNVPADFIINTITELPEILLNFS